MSMNDIFAMGTNIYTLNDGIDVRCAFIDIGDGSAYIGALFEHVSLNNEQTTLYGCPLTADCPHNEHDLETGESSLLSIAIQRIRLSSIAIIHSRNPLMGSRICC